MYWVGIRARTCEKSSMAVSPGRFMRNRLFQSFNLDAIEFERGPRLYNAPGSGDTNFSAFLYFFYYDWFGWLGILLGGTYVCDVFYLILYKSFFLY